MVCSCFKTAAFLTVMFLSLIAFPVTGSTETPRVEQAVAVIHPTQGNDIQGIVTFTQEKRGTYVQVDLQGLTPGKHGFHIHEYGDCSASDATSAGGHYNPTDMPHAGPDAAKRHVGDLGNVTADDSGRVSENFLDPVISLNGPHSLVGLSVVVHEGADDFTSQPSGDAGPRVGCGVVGIRKESGDRAN